MVKSGEWSNQVDGVVRAQHVVVAAVAGQNESDEMVKYKNGQIKSGQMSWSSAAGRSWGPAGQILGTMRVKKGQTTAK